VSVRPDNADLAELLVREGAEASGHRQRAYRRAARRAFTWPDEASDILGAGRSLTELPGVGPFLARVLGEWIAGGVLPDEVPDIRRGFLTMARAHRVLEGGALPIRGDLQMHTTWSDGGSSLREMAEAARERGYDYIAITDHSAPGLRIVQGLDEDALQRQGAEIASLNDEFAGALRVLRSVEMNLDPEGRGDVDPAALRRLDLVLGSFHSALRRTDDQTGRYLAAIANPDVHVLAHPRGRIYNHRIGLRADWPRVFAAAADADKALEIDAYPDRQDLDVQLLELARDAGVRISIGTDAHHHPQLDWIELGVAAAMEAGIASDRILNTMRLDALLAWASQVRERAA
jgi:putative hydrolase